MHVLNMHIPNMHVSIMLNLHVPNHACTKHACNEKEKECCLTHITKLKNQNSINKKLWNYTEQACKTNMHERGNMHVPNIHVTKKKKNVVQHIY